MAWWIEHLVLNCAGDPGLIPCSCFLIGFVPLNNGGLPIEYQQLGVDHGPFWKEAIDLVMS